MALKYKMQLKILLLVFFQTVVCRGELSQDALLLISGGSRRNDFGNFYIIYTSLEGSEKDIKILKIKKLVPVKISFNWINPVANST